MAYKQLYINGTGTGSFGIYITSDTYLNAPAPDYVAHQIPGRYGDLVQWNNRLNNIIRKFECYIPDNVQANFDGFKKLIYSNIGYMEITSDYEPDTYQRGYLADEIEAEPFRDKNNLTATFELYFSCEPQKYFKTGSSTLMLFTTGTWRGSCILPRSHAVIQDLFKALPASDIPEGEAFAVFGITSAITQGYTISDFKFDLTGYDGFVAMIFGTYLYMPGAASFRHVAAYSSFGGIDAAGPAYTIPTSNVELAVVIPANVTGTWTASAKNQNAVTYSESVTMASLGNNTNADAIGASYTIEISGEYGQASDADVEEHSIGVYVAGYLSGRKTISAIIDVDTNVFRNLSQSGQTYSASITINTEDMSVIGSFAGEPVKLSNYVGIYGTIDGMADRLEVYAYQTASNYTTHAIQPFYYQSFTVTPKWWKL